MWKEEVKSKGALSVLVTVSVAVSLLPAERVMVWRAVKAVGHMARVSADSFSVISTDGQAPPAEIGEELRSEA